ncbi:monovalent cation:proton antiporter-2 (CPA2) family protein [Dongshaea marina]|uniref:monovalent cation:proton antiporter-2 (CPA2) family protein n=1 Tax=Dongshaea marina TaxID=2047966 RepID=UPI000D3E0B05|nr:monovalent cation:proton antiporter-2 (CPA2) family protein [Dongshaea marina]
MISAYMTDIIILLCAAVIAVPLFQAVKLGSIPGFVIAGVIVGPSGLGLIDNITEISALAQFGVVLLLFIIGIELRPSQLWQMRRLVFGLGVLQVALTGMVLSFLIYILTGLELITAILVGSALALSSTAFVLQLLGENKQLDSQYGKMSFSVLLMQDLAVVPLLALISLLTIPDFTLQGELFISLMETLVILLVVILGGRYFLHPILHRVALAGSPEVFTTSAVLIVLGTATITEHIGLSMEMGAFLAGLLIGDSIYRHQVIAEIKPFRGLLLGLFFMSMGMSFNLISLIDNPLLILGLVCLLIILKIIIIFPLAYLFSRNGIVSLSTALMLAQSGEFALVIFSLALQHTILDTSLYQQLMLVVVLSMLFTPILSRLACTLSRSQGSDYSIYPPPPGIPVPIVLAGFGKVGHRIGEVLTKMKIFYIALDMDANRVKQQRSHGHPVFYGDVRQPEILHSASLKEAKILVVALDDYEATKQVVKTLHNSDPEMQICALGHSYNQCKVLQELGANMVVSDNLEASLEFTRYLLKQLAIDTAEREAILDEFRKDYYGQNE